jgi:hypothetical protein
MSIQKQTGLKYLLIDGKPGPCIRQHGLVVKLKEEKSSADKCNQQQDATEQWGQPGKLFRNQKADE